MNNNKQEKIPQGKVKPNLDVKKFLAKQSMSQSVSDQKHPTMIKTSSTSSKKPYPLVSLKQAVEKKKKDIMMKWVGLMQNKLQESKKLFDLKIYTKEQIFELIENYTEGPNSIFATIQSRFCE